MCSYLKIRTAKKYIYLATTRLFKDGIYSCKTPGDVFAADIT